MQAREKNKCEREKGRQKRRRRRRARRQRLGKPHAPAVFPVLAWWWWYLCEEGARVPLFSFVPFLPPSASPFSLLCSLIAFGLSVRVEWRSVRVRPWRQAVPSRAHLHSHTYINKTLLFHMCVWCIFVQNFCLLFVLATAKERNCTCLVN